MSIPIAMIRHVGCYELSLYNMVLSHAGKCTKFKKILKCTTKTKDFYTEKPINYRRVN